MVFKRVMWSSGCSEDRTQKGPGHVNSLVCDWDVFCVRVVIVVRKHWKVGGSGGQPR